MKTLKRAEVNELGAELLAGFRGALVPLGVKGKKLEDLAAGYQDGMWAMFRALRDKELFDVEEEPKP